jgi:hypothetical protein
MKITKFGHCCLLIETKGKRILTDPGSWSSLQNDISNLDIILITHEHTDHMHVESLQTILSNNKDVQIFTNSGVGKILSEKGIGYSLLENGTKEDVGSYTTNSTNMVLFFCGLPSLRRMRLCTQQKTYGPTRSPSKMRISCCELCRRLGRNLHHGGFELRDPWNPRSLSFLSFLSLTTHP